MMFEKGQHYSQPNPQGHSPDNVISPKRVGNLNYNAFRSSIGTHPKEARLLPMELRPVLNHENDVKDDENLREGKSSIYSMQKPSGFQSKQYRIPRRPRSTPPLFPRNNFFGPNRCSNTPDVYRHILGPTPDESILAGLQTVIDICGLVDYCHSDSEVSITSADHGRNDSHTPSTKYGRTTAPYGQNVFDSYTVSKTKTHSPGKDKSNSREDTSINMDDTFMIAESGAPSVDRTSPYETPNSSFIETSTPIKHESVPILKKENSLSQESHTQSFERDVSFASAPSYREDSLPTPISEEPTSAQPSLQQSRERSFEHFIPSPQRSFATEESPYMIDSPVPSQQHQAPQIERDEDAGSIERVSSGSWCKIDECCGTADSLPCVTVKTKDGKHVCIKYRCKSIESSLSTKCFPPVEIPPCDFSCKKCSIMDSTLNLADIGVPIGGSRCTCSSSVDRNVQQIVQDWEIELVKEVVGRPSKLLMFYCCKQQF